MKAEEENLMAEETRGRLINFGCSTISHSSHLLSDLSAIKVIIIMGFQQYHRQKFEEIKFF